MTKRNFVLVVLLFASVCAFAEPKTLNVGSYKIGDVSISCWDDCVLLIKDSKKLEIYIYCIDIDTLIRASAKTKEIMESNNIYSVEQMLKFFDKEKIQYEYQKSDNSSDYLVRGQAFLEEYLVPKHGIKTGRKEIHADHTREYKNWNKGKQWYDYCLETYADYIAECKNWNKAEKLYEYAFYTYADHTMELKWNKGNHYRLDTYADHTTEFKNWNKGKEWFDYRLDKYADHTKEHKDWNGEDWDYRLETYADLTVERKDYNKGTKGYDYHLDTYADHTELYKNWNGVFYDYRLDTYTDHTEEHKNWNKDEFDYDYRLDTYTDRTVERKRVDGTYFDVDIKDKSGKVISYAYVITPLKKGKRDIEVFSGGVVYQYFGVQQTKGDKFIFKSIKKIENGTTTKMKGGTLSAEDFYMDAWLE